MVPPVSMMTSLRTLSGICLDRHTAGQGASTSQFNRGSFDAALFRHRWSPRVRDTRSHAYRQRPGGWEVRPHSRTSRQRTPALTTFVWAFPGSPVGERFAQLYADDVSGTREVPVPVGRAEGPAQADSRHHGGGRANTSDRRSGRAVGRGPREELGRSGQRGLDGRKDGGGVGGRIRRASLFFLGPSAGAPGPSLNLFTLHSAIAV